MRAREPASFWRENVIAVVILLQVYARMSYWWKQVYFAIRRGLFSTFSQPSGYKILLIALLGFYRTK